MPKYSENKVCDCYLYFTSECILEAMHAHANEKAPVRRGAAEVLAEFFGISYRYEGTH